MNIEKICNRIIEYSFCALFFLVPLVFTSNTSELFEFNKMWLTFGLTIIIAASWFIKMVLQRRIFIQRTLLDIPIALFLLSQILSTIFSMDMHVSIWGYYSRFNGGLLSVISYIFLYYAFVSNFDFQARGDVSGGVQRRASAFAVSTRLAGAPLDERVAGPRAIEMVKRLIYVSLASGLIVALWGLPSHFGYDPTCLIFRGHFDVSCWTDAFQPKVRIFSTLGQPNWLATYLSILLPLAIIFSLNYFSSSFNSQEKNQKSPIRQAQGKNQKSFIFAILFLIFTILFYFDLLYTNSQSGYIGFLFSIAFMSIFILLINIK